MPALPPEDLLSRPAMPAEPEDPPTGRQRNAARHRFVTDLPVEDYADLSRWGRDTGTSAVAILVGMIRHAPLDPGLRVRIEEEAAEYHRAGRLRPGLRTSR